MKYIQITMQIQSTLDITEILVNWPFSVISRFSVTRTFYLGSKFKFTKGWVNFAQIYRTFRGRVDTRHLMNIQIQNSDTLLKKIKIFGQNSGFFLLFSEFFPKKTDFYLIEAISVTRIYQKIKFSVIHI